MTPSQPKRRPGMTEELRSKVIAALNEIMLHEPRGLHTGEASKRVKERLHLQEQGGVFTAILKYARQPDAEVYQPARGWVRHKNAPPPPDPPEVIPEDQFYKPFARWLVEDLEECSKAVPVGGAKLQDKYGTPDVIGVYRPSEGDKIKFSEEIVSAEIKTDPSTHALVEAFSQACAYTLFSHKCYVVVPRDAKDDAKDRLDSLCVILGIGLIEFDAHSPDAPDFRIKTRAVKREPDMFYANEKIKRIWKELGEAGDSATVA